MTSKQRSDCQDTAPARGSCLIWSLHGSLEFRVVKGSKLFPVVARSGVIRPRSQSVSFLLRLSLIRAISEVLKKKKTNTATMCLEVCTSECCHSQGLDLILIRILDS